MSDGLRTAVSQRVRHQRHHHAMEAVITQRMIDIDADLQTTMLGEVSPAESAG